MAQGKAGLIGKVSNRSQSLADLIREPSKEKLNLRQGKVTFSSACLKGRHASCHQLGCTCPHHSGGFVGLKKNQTLKVRLTDAFGGAALQFIMVEVRQGIKYAASYTITEVDSLEVAGFVLDRLWGMMEQKGEK